MEMNGKTVCNVCLKEDNSEKVNVFIKAICRGEDVHICTSCIPHVIHGSGDIVKSNDEVSAKV